LAGLFTQLLLPTRCLLCQKLGPAVLCERCQASIERIGIHCSRCGRRRQTAFISPDCGECHGRVIGVSRARSLLLYNGPGRKLLAEFKYRGRQAAGKELAGLLQEWLRPGFGRVFDLISASGEAQLEAPWPMAIVPVPLHPARLRQRRFNQAEVLSRSVSQSLSLPVWPALLRSRDTESQVGKSRNQRQENVRGAFEVGAHWRDRLRGACVLLVDDVMTTGATLRACSAAMRRGGAAATYGLTLFSTSHGVEPAVADEMS
jgi:ComF family protein